jgi:hypothetical protein
MQSPRRCPPCGRARSRTASFFASKKAPPRRCSSTVFQSPARGLSRSMEAVVLSSMRRWTRWPRESPLAIAFGRRGRAPGVVVLLLTYRAAQVGIKRRSATEHRRRRSFTHALFVRIAPPSAARAAASARPGEEDTAAVLCVLRPSGSRRAHQNEGTPPCIISGTITADRASE